MKLLFKIILFSLLIIILHQSSYCHIVKKINLGDPINSIYDESNPRISPDGKTLYFIRQNHPENTFAKQVDNSQDIWFSNLDENGKWKKARRMEKPFNQRTYNSVFSLSPDGNRLLIRGAYKNGKFLGSGFSFCDRSKDGWFEPEKLEIMNISELNKGNSDGAYLSNDGKVLLLYFSDNPQSKNYDIYASFLDSNNTWSEPLTLGENVNTEFDELTPFLASDGITLYFSSNRPGSNNCDIYISRRLDDTWQNWSPPVNLGDEINTSGWDAYFSIDAKAEYGYMVSNNPYSKGDIVKFLLPDEFKPRPVVLVSGNAIDAVTGKPIPAIIRIELLPDGKEYGIAYSDPETGLFKLILPYGNNYGFTAKIEGYLSESDNINLIEKGEYKEIKRDLQLVPFALNSTIVLNNLFFDFAKSTIRPESFPELDRLAKVLMNNATVEIEISGHSDNRGTDERNLIVSSERAKAVKDYLIKKGIDQKRLTSIGFGKNKPITTNNTDEGRQKNRRVEIKVTKL